MVRYLHGMWQTRFARWNAEIRLDHRQPDPDHVVVVGPMALRHHLSTNEFSFGAPAEFATGGQRSPCVRPKILAGRKRPQTLVETSYRLDFLWSGSQVPVEDGRTHKIHQSAQSGLDSQVGASIPRGVGFQGLALQCLHWMLG